MQKNRFQTIRVLFSVMAGLLISATVATALERPINKVVVVVDNSGSYRSRQAEALDRTVKLLEDLSKAKLHRWEKGDDRIYLVSLDAMPEVVWQGGLRELKAMDHSRWSKRFEARSDYGSCTDVVKAFKLSAQLLEGDPRYVGKYLIAFSDLIHEPPLNSVNRPRPAEKVPEKGFPWSDLKDVSVKVFWMPPEQKFLWQQAADRYGLTENFHLFSSESNEETLGPPPPAREKKTETDRAMEKGKFVDRVLGFMVLALAVIVGAVIFIGLIFGGIFLLRRNRHGSSPMVRRVNPHRIRPLPVPRRNGVLPGLQGHRSSENNPSYNGRD